MDHSQVAIQTDTAQETNGDVDVLIEQEARYLTQPFIVMPVIILKWHDTTWRFTTLLCIDEKSDRHTFF